MVKRLSPKNSSRQRQRNERQQGIVANETKGKRTMIFIIPRNDLSARPIPAFHTSKEAIMYLRSRFERENGPFSQPGSVKKYEAFTQKFLWKEGSYLKASWLQKPGSEQKPSEEKTPEEKAAWSSKKESEKDSRQFPLGIVICIHKQMSIDDNFQTMRYQQIDSW